MLDLYSNDRVYKRRRPDVNFLSLLAIVTPLSHKVFDAAWRRGLCSGRLTSRVLFWQSESKFSFDVQEVFRMLERLFSGFVLVGLVLCMLAGAATCAFSADENEENRFKSLSDAVWEFDMVEDPLRATWTGDHRFNDRLPSETKTDQLRRQAKCKDFLAELEKIDRTKLSRPVQIDYDIFVQLLRDRVTEYEFESYLIPITNREGFHLDFVEAPNKFPFNTVQDYENYIARLNAFRRYTGENIELMREGLKKGMTLPSEVLGGFLDGVNPHVVDDPAKSLLFAPFKKFPDRISEGDRARLTEAGKKAIADFAVPAFAEFRDFCAKEYLPGARGSTGALALPRGREFYRYRIKHFTTLDIAPEQVHETGLNEMKRIRAEMAAVMKKAKFEGNHGAFIKFLRTDERFYPKSKEELLEKVAFALKKIDGQLPSLFKTLPRTPYGIKEVPDYIAPRTTTAYYQQPAGDGARAGFYFVNTYNLKSRPLFEVEALSLHEAVPGHHLQIALQQELDLPKFRRFAGFTVFVEGWGLYSERLGLETGFYQDPYSDFGRLSYEMWRACRLVVDTGIHHFGWTRKQAIDFMAENTALSLHNIEAEVDRYISWPGQAVAYKTGELKIRELRARAEKELGAKFDVREFHDVVLGSGAVPLNVLEENVKSYINRVKRG
jgi:uncharacterized protein (DUF885 family)